MFKKLLFTTVFCGLMAFQTQAAQLKHYSTDKVCYKNANDLLKQMPNHTAILGGRINPPEGVGNIIIMVDNNGWMIVIREIVGKEVCVLTGATETKWYGEDAAQALVNLPQIQPGD